MILSSLEKPLVRYPVYLFTGFVIFALSMALTFPDDEIKEIISVQAEKQLDHKYRVYIGELDLWRLSGIALESVSIEERVDETEEVNPDLPPELPTKIRLQSVRARFAPLASLLNLAPTVVFDADTGGGIITGEFAYGQSESKLGVETQKLDLRQANLLTTLTGMPFFGEFDLETEFIFDSKFQPVDGYVKARGQQITIGPATIQTDKFPPMSYFEIPQTNFGTILIDLDMAEPVNERASATLEFNRFESSGRDIRMEMWGNIGMAPKFGRARPKLQMRLQLDDTFVKDNSLSPLLNVGEVRKGKGRDWYGFTLNGTFDRIQFKGSAAASQGNKEAPTEPEK